MCFIMNEPQLTNKLTLLKLTLIKTTEHNKVTYYERSGWLAIKS